MHHIIYLSQAVAPFSDEQLQDLLLQARSYNAEQDITGILLYGNNQFVQVLEGEEAAVRALYEHIRQDTRHRDSTTFADKDIEQRAFEGWAMAFHPVDSAQFREVIGYLNPTELRINQPNLRLADAQLVDLLRSFVLP